MIGHERCEREREPGSLFWEGKHFILECDGCVSSCNASWSLTGGHSWDLFVFTLRSQSQSTVMPGRNLPWGEMLYLSPPLFFRPSLSRRSLFSHRRRDRNILYCHLSCFLVDFELTVAEIVHCGVLAG